MISLCDWRHGNPGDRSCLTSQARTDIDESTLLTSFRGTKAVLLTRRDMMLRSAAFASALLPADWPQELSGDASCFTLPLELACAKLGVQHALPKQLKLKAELAPLATKRKGGHEFHELNENRLAVPRNSCITLISAYTLCDQRNSSNSGNSWPVFPACGSRQGYSSITRPLSAASRDFRTISVTR